MNDIASEWKDFRQQTVPPDASEGQVRDMRLAFYSGAMALLVVGKTVANSGGTGRDAGLAMLRRLPELLEFFRKVHADDDDGEPPPKPLPVPLQ